MSNIGAAGLAQSLSLDRLYTQEAQILGQLDVINNALISTVGGLSQQTGSPDFSGGNPPDINNSFLNSVNGDGTFQKAAELKKEQSRLEAALRTVQSASEKMEQSKDGDAKNVPAFSGQSNG